MKGIAPGLGLAPSSRRIDRGQRRQRRQHRQRLQRFHLLEVGVCLRLVRIQRQGWALRLFRGVSLAGDGLFWFALAAALPLFFGTAALPTVRRMAAVGIAAALVSAGLKAATARARPFRSHREIPAGASPLDRYSFPSGHTLHAVAFSIVVLASYGLLAWILVPFTAAVALSRVVLGLHYPTDVAAGALLGSLLAATTLALF